MPEKRHLISIGINDYDTKPLNFCAKDAADIVECMTKFCNLEYENVYELVSTFNKPHHHLYEDLQSSVRRIRSSFLPQEDSIFFFFSGHGVKSSRSTTMLFHDKIIELNSVFQLFGELNPKFIFALIDSCYSGVGITEEREKSNDELNFLQQVKVATGYTIICASAADAPAKEDADFKNGRLTRLFLDTVQNKLRYRNGVLSLNNIFQSIDEAFKENPYFRQFPFYQSKGLSTYPIACLTEQSQYFVTHYIDAIENYDWEQFKIDLRDYCGISKNIAFEFTRLLREIIRNRKMWANATFIKIEISNNSVSVQDNSSDSFDIFKIESTIKPHGGGITAKKFKEKFEEFFEYQYIFKEDETIQIFTFKPNISMEDPCNLTFENTMEIWQFQRGETVKIPEQCEDYIVNIPAGFLDLSTIHVFLEATILTSTTTGKQITLVIDEDDILKEHFIEAFSHYNDVSKVKLL